jgi:hypothetical protein
LPRKLTFCEWCLRRDGRLDAQRVNSSL